MLGGPAVLSGAANLEECESILRPHVLRVEILAEVLLDEDDLNLLTGLIRTLFRGKPSGALRSLVRSYPASFLCFMVWKAKTSYHEGSFWPPILESLGLSGVRWERELGKAFLRCLEEMKLPGYEIAGSNRYVTPILMHGGIPDACTDAFFRYVVTPFVRDGILEPNAIRLEVEILRREDFLYRELDCRERELQSAIGDVDRLLHRLEDYIETKNTFTQLMQEIERSQPDGGLTGLREQESLRVAATIRIDDALSQLMDARTQAVDAVAGFTREDKEMLKLAEDIEALAGLWRDLEHLKARHRTQSALLRETECNLIAITRSILGVEWNVELSGRWKAISLEDLRQRIAKRDSALAELASSGWISDEVLGTRSLKPPRAGSWLAAIRVGGGLAALAACAGFLAALPKGPFTWLCIPWSFGPAGRLGLIVGSLILAGVAAALRVWSGKIREELARFNHLAEVWARSSSAIRACLWEIVGSENSSKLDSLRVQKFSLADVDGLRNMVSLVNTREELELDVGLTERQMGEIQEKIRSISQRSPLLSSVPGPGSICLGRQLREARLRQSEAESSVRLLNTRIDPKLKALLYSKLYLLLEGLIVFRKVEEFGGGDFQEGLLRLERLQRLKLEARVLVKRLKATEAEFDKLGIDPEKDMDYYRNLRSRLAKQLTETAREKNKYSPAFGVWVDEPVARYILFGGDSALRFLQESVRLVWSGGKTGSAQQSVPAENLARRSYDIWIKTLREREPSRASQVYAYPARAPQLIFRETDGRVNVRLPEQRLPLEKVQKGLVLEVVFGQTVEHLELMTFKEDSDWCRTGYLEVPVPFPDKPVLLRVTARNQSSNGEKPEVVETLAAQEFRTADDGALLNWTVGIPGREKPVSFFKVSDGTEITNELPRDTVWVVLAPSWRPPSDMRVLEEMELTGEWYGYRALFLDLVQWNRGDVVFLSDDGDRRTFRVRDEGKLQEPYLDGEAAPFLLNGEPVYVKTLPWIVLETRDDSDLSDWRIHMIKVTEREYDQVGEPGVDRNGIEGNVSAQKVPDGEAKSVSTVSVSLDLASLYKRIDTTIVQASPIVRVDNPVDGNDAARVARIPLHLPEMKVSGPVSSYILHLLGPGRKRFVYSFSVISDTYVEFNPALVGPYDKPFPVEMSMILPEDVEFHPEGAVVVGGLEPGFALITVESDKKAVEGTLNVEGGKTYRVRIPIPRISVMLEGNGTVREDAGRMMQVGIKDLMGMESPRLSISFHAYRLNAVTWVELRLGQTGHLARRRVERGSVSFGLAEFFDTLRTQSEAAVFTITLYSGDCAVLDPIPVLRVLTRWLVKDLDVRCRMDGGELLADFQWSETGTEDERTIKLWPVHSFWSEPVEISVPSRKTSVSVRMNPEFYRPGPFFVRFVTARFWGSDAKSQTVPRPGEANFFQVNIVPEGSVLDAFSVEWSSGEISGPDVAGSPGIEEHKCDAVYMWLDKTEIVLESLEMTISAGRLCGSVPSYRLGKTIAVAVYCKSLDLGIIELNPNPPTVRLPIDDLTGRALLEFWGRDELSLVLVPSAEPATAPSGSSLSFELPQPEHSASQYPVTDQQAVQLLKSAIENQEAQVRLRFAAGTYEVPVRLYGNGSGKMKLVRGVRCTSCNSYFPNQAEFHRHHYYCKWGAKAMELNCNDAPFRAYLEWKPFGDVLSAKFPGFKDNVREFLTVARWCTEKAGKKWLSLLSEGSGMELARAIFWVEVERRKGLRSLGLL